MCDTLKMQGESFIHYIDILKKRHKNTFKQTFSNSASQLQDPQSQKSYLFSFAYEILSQKKSKKYQENKKITHS